MGPSTWIRDSRILESVSTLETAYGKETAMTVADRRVVVTGKIPGESRETAQARLREAGAIVQDTVGKTTDILVTGDAVGMSKINKAKALGVEIIPWAEAFNGKTNGSSSKTPLPPRAPLPSVRQWNPMLCKAGELPAGGSWSHEIKWDGVRCVATIQDGGVMACKTGCPVHWALGVKP